MQRKLILAAAGVALATGVGATLAFDAAPPWRAANAEAALAAQPVHSGGDPRGWWRGGRHGGGGGLAMLCSPRRDERVEGFLGRIEGMLTLTPDQTQAWQAFTETVRTGGGSIDELCGEFREAGAPETASERLERLERTVETGLGVVRDVRPAFDAFYATLEAEQRKVVDGLIAPPRRRS